MRFFERESHRQNTDFPRCRFIVTLQFFVCPLAHSVPTLLRNLTYARACMDCPGPGMRWRATPLYRRLSSSRRWSSGSEGWPSRRPTLAPTVRLSATCSCTVSTLAQSTRHSLARLSTDCCIVVLLNNIFILFLRELDVSMVDVCMYIFEASLLSIGL